MTIIIKYPQHLNFILSEHPSIVNFRWSPTDTWGATWSFLITSIAAYVTITFTLHVLLLLLRRRKPVPLGPIPALHSLSMSLLSAAVFAGILLSAAAEIRDTRWFWRRSKTPFQWLLCFPLGTRPSGRVFFWSYVFYLSRFVHVFRTFFNILRKPGSLFPGFQVVNHSALICMAFVWLEFSQSFQVLAILSTTLVLAVVYGYRFCTEIGWRRKSGFPVVMVCQIVLVVANVGWHLGVLVLHYWKGGCNGMGAWVFNTVLNTFLLILVFNFYVKRWCLNDFSAFSSSSSSSSATVISKTKL